jgi:hypothetical protein
MHHFVPTVFAAGLMAVGTFSHAAMIADFEPPAYEGNPATQTDIDGTNGWNATGGTGLLYPDNTSGYVPPTYPPLSGTQSYVLYGGYQARGFGAAAAAVADGSILSMLSGVETFSGIGANGAAFYLSSNAALGGGSTPGGIEYWGPTKTFSVYGAGGSTVTAVPFAIQTKYLLEMELDFTNDTFDAYVTDITNSGPRTLLANDKGFASALSAANVASDGGVLIYHAPGGNAMYADDIQINTVPEPASIGLLGLGLLALIRRRSR